MMPGSSATEGKKSRTNAPARLLIILMAMNMVAYFDRSILSLAAPAVQADLGLTHVQLSLLLGLGFVAFFVVLGIPFGWLVDRVSRRWIVHFGILAWSVAASSAGLARDFFSLLLCRFGVGAGEATLHPAAYSMIADSVPPRRLALAMTLYGGSSGLGAALSVAVGGLLLGFATAHGPFDLALFGHLQPWQFVLLLSGLPGLILAYTIFLVPEPARNDTLAAHTNSPETQNFTKFFCAHWRFYVPSILGFAILQIAAYSFASWQPTYMVQHFGWKIADVGLALSIGMAGAFFGSLGAGWAVDWLIARGVQDAPLRWAAWSSLFCGGFIGTAFLVNNAFWCIALVVIGQLPIALIGVVSTALQQVTPNEYRGQTSAIFLLFANLVGFGAGPLLPAVLTDYVFRDNAALGFSVAITVLISAPCAALLLWLGCRPMRHGLTEAAKWRDRPKHLLGPN
jgi:MFS family permease